MFIVGEENDLNTPQKEVGLNLNFKNMKKLIYGAMALTIGLLIYACNKEDVKNLKRADESKTNIVEDLNNIFSEIDNDEITTKSSLKLNVPLANEHNPFDNVGVQHNEVLRYLRSLELTESTICNSLPAVNKEFQVEITLNCDELLSLIDNGAAKTFDNEGSYKADLLNDLLSKTKISNNEYLVVNTTINAVFNLNNLNQKIALLKASENYARNSPFLTNNEKARIQRTFAIYRYSTFYWEIEDAVAAKGPIASAADAMAEYWASNSPDSPAQDGSDIHAFSGLVSSVFVALGY